MATSSSGGSNNSKDFEDYISEVQDIEKSKVQDDSGEDDSSKTPDGKHKILLKDKIFGKTMQHFPATSRFEKTIVLFHLDEMVPCGLRAGGDVATVKNEI